MDKNIKLTLRRESSREACFAFEMQIGLARFWKESARKVDHVGKGGSDGWRKGLVGCTFGLAEDDVHDRRQRRCHKVV